MAVDDEQGMTTMMKNKWRMIVADEQGTMTTMNDKWGMMTNGEQRMTIRINGDCEMAKVQCPPSLT